MFNSAHVLAGIVSVTAIRISSGNAENLSTLMDFHGELSGTTAPLPLHIQSRANTDMQLCAHKLSPVFLLRGTSFSHFQLGDGFSFFFFFFLILFAFKLSLKTTGGMNE